MWELVKAGGWLMLPLVGLSVWLLALLFERYTTLKMVYVPDSLADELLLHLQSGADESVLDELAKTSILADILVAGASVRQSGQMAVESAMMNLAAGHIHRLEKNINIIGTIGAVAPLLGLLGTVFGIIVSFLAVSDGTMADPSMLAGGISQALITTALGMMVAIPAVFAHRHLARKILDINAQFEANAGYFLRQMQKRGLL